MNSASNPSESIEQEAQLIVLPKPAPYAARVGTQISSLRAALAALWRALLRIRIPRWITTPLAAFLATRLIVTAVAYLAVIAMPGAPGADRWHIDPDNLLLDVWARWDSGFYLAIAKDGYSFIPGKMSSVAFFPLYPLLINLTSAVVGNALLAGVLVSHLCLFGALVFLYRLAELWFDDHAAAARAVYYIAAFPSALFFSAVYTESTFLLCSVAAAYFARRRMWAWAALAGILTASSRIIGVLIWAIILYEWLAAQGWSISQAHRASAWRALLYRLRHSWPGLAVILLVPLGLLCYMQFLRSQFGDSLAFWSTQQAWGRENLGPLAIIWRDLSTLVTQDFLRGKIWWNTLVDLLAIGLALGLAIPIGRRFGAGYALYSLAGVLLPASSGTGSMIRYILVLFPIFLMLAQYGRREWLDRAITIGFSVMLGLFTVIFANWFFLA